MKLNANQTWIKTLAITAVAAIVVGAVALRCSFLDASMKNWTPIHLPLPAQGMSVSEPFELASGGRFQFQIVTGVTNVEQAALSREGPPVGIGITYEISGSKGFRISRAISQMKLSSWSSDTDIYTAGILTLPLGGDYDILLRCGKRPMSFADRGGVVQLQRVAPSGYGLLYPVLNGFAYLCFFCSCACIVLIARR